MTNTKKKHISLSRVHATDFGPTEGSFFDRTGVDNMLLDLQPFFDPMHGSGAIRKKMSATPTKQTIIQPPSYTVAANNNLVAEHKFL
jgi:hypothetical protein